MLNVYFLVCSLVSPSEGTTKSNY